MNNDRLIAELKEVCKTPGPDRKEAFFQRMGKHRMTVRRPVVMSHGEFMLRQSLYIQKWVWVLSTLILLIIVGLTYSHPGNYPFALTPLLTAVLLAETRRSFRWKMAELEHAARFSLRSVVFARMFFLGAVDTVGLLVVIWVVRPMFSYSLIRVFLYMMVPYLTAALAASYYEREQRPDTVMGSMIICLLSSVFFAAAPFICSLLYEERLIFLWAAAFILLALSLAAGMRKWICETEDVVWN